MQLTAIILAGGKSSRMGSDKGLTVYNGIPLVQYSINVCEKVTGNIIISTGNEAYGRFGYPMVADNFRECGPIGGLEATLARSETELNIVCPCDMPLISPGILNQLLEKAHTATTVVVQDPEGKDIPVLGVYSRSALPVIRDQIERQEYRMTQLLQRLEANRVIVEFSGQLVNINFQEDLP